MNTYSATQINLLRTRLKAYRARNPGEGRKCLSWAEISLDIADIAGTRVPAERLRQFVEGASRKSGKGPSMLGSKRLDAVRDFLMDEEISVIHEREWTARPKENHASLLIHMPVDEYLRLEEEGFFTDYDVEPLTLPHNDDDDAAAAA